ncbi:MAG: 2-oxoglutarate dehydrogenase complex dihydrolipoyllysine-residue succinyltransferase [Chloroflexi bacterium]|nr:2-oxoglutarate dehydrogenase complex dihydrolipoyllysine-residue succinyltransferase [Chloroflexota bacterium]
MPSQIVVPELGESVVEATVSRWLKKVGDPVAAGDEVVELETDKVDLKVSAHQAGILTRIDRQEGEDVSIGDVLGEIGESAGAATTVAPQPEAKAPPGPLEKQTAAPPRPESQPAKGAEPEPDADGSRVTPLAKRIAEEQGIDLSRVPGSGSAGRITREDVQRYAEEQKPPAPAAAPAPPPPQPAVPTPGPRPAPPLPPVAQPATVAGREERIRLSRRRQTIARRLVEAQRTAAMLTTFNEIDMAAVMEIRKKRRDSFKERHGVGLGFMSFFTKAAIGALKAFPQVNAELDGDELILKKYYDIGIAIGAEEGLVVPVIHDADRLTFAGIEQAIKDFVARSQNATLSLEDLRGGTFTITNGGVFGSLLSTPILNPPQVGILGLHKIEERPIAANGQVVIRPMMYVALSYDHRVVDGRQAVQFLVRIKELIEDPEALLLEG